MPATRERDETFTVLDGHLVRSVVPARGKPYEHRCPRASFETIAHAADEFGDLTTQMLPQPAIIRHSVTA